MAGRVELVETKKVRVARRTRAERVTRIVFTASTIFFVVVGLGPIPVAGILGLVSGVYPTQEQGGIIGHVPGYPAFPYFAWLIFLPAAAALFLSVYTIPLPLKRVFAIRRSLLTLVVLFELGWSPVLAAAFFDKSADTYPVAVWAVPVFAVAFLLLLLRALLGALRVLPEAWRTEITTTPRAKVVESDV